MSGDGEESLTGYLAAHEARILAKVADGAIAATPAQGVGPGSLIGGRYRLERIVGEGGMGSVWLATQEDLDRQVAVKCLKPKTGEDTELVERFMREAKAVAAVSHENVVSIHDVGTMDDGAPFLVMELVDGRPLSETMKPGEPQPWARVEEMLRQLTDALGHAHDAGVIHRDLKPENILVVERRGKELFKLIDFGLAKVLDATELSQSGQVFGTPHYMSPEQIRGDTTLDQRTDVYALGVIAYQMLAGKRPFPGDEITNIMYGHLFAEIPDLPAEVEQGATLSPILARAMTKAADQRYPTMDALADAIKGHGESAVSKTADAPTIMGSTVAEPPSRRANWGWVVSGSVAFLGLGLGLFWSATPETNKTGLPPTEPAAVPQTPTLARPATDPPPTTKTTAPRKPIGSVGAEIEPAALDPISEPSTPASKKKKRRSKPTPNKTETPQKTKREQILEELEALNGEATGA